MRANMARVLRDRLGEEPAEALVAFVTAAGEEWKQDVLDKAGERFERRLSEECSRLRVEMAEGFGGIRQEMGLLEARLHKEIAASIRWSFLFWVGQVATIAAMLAFVFGRA